ncbi:uncharacterized protein LOC119740459 [Patiria miniata]|uniref:RING-CH-type domain-containing protein n=1 Tax=Patiria miniata TaxID=46514 RepID=A0A914B654_PATMI|nr:uncharacterized protein LOC119740459 [Patiria miniata]
MSAPRFCRICFEGEQHIPPASSSCLSCLPSGPAGAANPLIRPCLCSGTAACVHLMCLQRWQAHSKSAVCELCQAPFEIPKGLRITEVTDAMDQQALTGSPQGGAGIGCLQKLAVSSVYTILVLIPLTAMVLIISLPLGQRWKGETWLDTSLGMLVRVILSLLVLGVYVLTIYCCIFKRGCLLNWMNTSRQRQRWPYPRAGAPHNTEWNHPLMYRGVGNRDYHYMDIAFML